MNRAVVDKVAAALLYEGYLLYPYRRSVKNCQRWTFGALYPPQWTELQTGSDASVMQTQCLIQADGTAGTPTLHVIVKFLHLVDRTIGQLIEPVQELPADGEPPFRTVTDLQIGDQQFCAWQEAVEREVDLGEVELGAESTALRQSGFVFPANRAIEPLRAPAPGIAPGSTSVSNSGGGGGIIGILIRQQQAIDSVIEIAAEPVAPDVQKVTVRILNRTPLDGADYATRDEALMRTLVSTHTILGVQGGRFISLLEPPAPLEHHVAKCKNVGTWPVLVGAAAAADTMLSSPIILYDYPQIAAESPGDLFDATEIDEILSLRILTLTDAEKAAAAATDDRVRNLLARTEALAQQQIRDLHGTIRGMRPVNTGTEGTQGTARTAGTPETESSTSHIPHPPSSILPSPETAGLDHVTVGGTELRTNQRVRLRPLGRADIMDIVLDGKLATIVAIEKDFEDRIHVAVTVDDDPGKDLGLRGQPGHRFFFGIDEVEPLDQEAMQP